VVNSGFLVINKYGRSKKCVFWSKNSGERRIIKGDRSNPFCICNVLRDNVYGMALKTFSISDLLLVSTLNLLLAFL
jgi:hypothetical protein